VIVHLFFYAVKRIYGFEVKLPYMSDWSRNQLPKLCSVWAPYNRKLLYRGADKSLARPGRKQANVSVRMAWISFGALPCRGGGKLDDSSRLDVVEIARVPNMLRSLFPSWSG